MKDAKIFLIAGKARSGKDTVADIMEKHYEAKGQKVVKLGFSEHIKTYAKKITGWDGNDKTKPRELLQVLGTDIIRNKIDKDFFVKRTCEDIVIYKYYFDVIIISDVRYPNELEEPKKRFQNVITVKVDRPNFENELTEKEKKHATETALDNYTNYDYTIENDGDLNTLTNKVETLIEEVEHGH